MANKNEQFKNIHATRTQDFNELSRGERVYRMHEIMQFMNNEEAYYDCWIVWGGEDGLDRDGYMDGYYDSDEGYEDAIQAFEKIYKEYHEDGLFANKYPVQIIKDCKMFDKLFNLPEIDIL